MDSNQSDVAALAASVAGGPVARQELNTKTAIQPDIVQQALSQASASAGALDAPAAFQAAQARSISAPLNADIGAGNAAASARSAYQSALSGANNNYLSSVQQSYGPAQAALEAAAQGYTGYEKQALQAVRRLQRQDVSDANAVNTLKNQSTAQAKAELDNRINGAQQDAAADPNVTPGALVAIRKVLGTATDVNTAQKLFDSEYTIDPKTGSISDSQGNVINQDAKGNIDSAAAGKIYSYLTQAFAPTGPAATPGAVLQPGTPEYDQFMSQYGNTEADGNYAGGQ